LAWVTRPINKPCGPALLSRALAAGDILSGRNLFTETHSMKKPGAMIFSNLEGFGYPL